MAQGFQQAFTAADIKNLIALSDRADELWQKVLDERLQFLEKTRQFVKVWGQAEPENTKTISIQQCDRELDWLHRPTGAYARLKLAMDYWCALWFWGIPEADKLPTRQQFMDDMAAIFNAGEESGFEKEPEQMGLFKAPEKPKQAKLADLRPITIGELLQEPRLHMAATTATHQNFNHWELVSPEVFYFSGGFDLRNSGSNAIIFRIKIFSPAYLPFTACLDQRSRSAFFGYIYFGNIIGIDTA